MDSVETASVGVWVGSGTRHEPAEINGVAHLLEHMAFKGTHRRSAPEIVREIEDVGGHINAYTSREQTAYYAKVLKDDTPLAFDILADILQNSVFNPEELARERAVVLQEIGQANDTPDDIVFDHFQTTAFPDQPMGRPVLGTPEIVTGMSREAIMDYMGRVYGGSRMVLSAVGAVDHDETVRMAADLFGGMSPNSDASSRPGEYHGGDYRENRDLEQVHLVLGFPSFSYHDEDFYAAAVFASLFGGGMSSRLFQEIREKRGLAYSIYAFSSYYMDCGYFAIYAGTGENDLAELTPALCGEIRGLVDTIDEYEVKRARNQLKSGTLMGLESTSSRCEQIAQQMLIYGRRIPLSEQVALIDAVDVAAVAKVADRIFSGRPTLAAIGPVDNLMAYDDLRGRLAP
ncbi:MAG: insulinase family protein [Rhodospirillaceae bacterium]|nr:insulinase family protein [Rhodospirillaceae bacterium]MBT5666249.1 insulinase family protein [Rhodospirillaceae bacterium]